MKSEIRDGSTETFALAQSKPSPSWSKSKDKFKCSYARFRQACSKSEIQNLPAACESWIVVVGGRRRILDFGLQTGI